MSNQTNSETRQWGSRFGYLMVAAGAAIGLGNIWRFPYLAYQGGGGVFLVVYIIVVALMGHPMVEMETAIGRHTGKDAVTAFQRINKKWGIAGWIANVCTLMINMYYVVVGGWVAKYAFQYIVSGDLGCAYPFICVHYAVFRDHKYSGKNRQSYDACTFRLTDHLRHMGTGCK